MLDFREADFPIFQFLVVVVHVFSPIIWIGGSIFLTLVMIPVARVMEPPAMGFLFLRRAALRFSGIVWVLLALLAISGALALDGRGIWSVWGRWFLVDRNRSCDSGQVRVGGFGGQLSATAA